MGPNMGPTWAPRGGQKRPKILFQIDPESPFFGFDVGKPWKTDFGAIWGPSWGPLGPILGASGANLGPSWAHLGGQLGSFRAFVAHLEKMLMPMMVLMVVMMMLMLMMRMRRRVHQPRIWSGKF